MNERVTQRVVLHIRDVYGCEGDQPWAKYPGNTVFRLSGSKKWFALLIRDLPEKALGLGGGGRRDILNLKCDTKLTGTLVDRARYFPGYHMNKEHWISVILDEATDWEEVKSLIALSYDLSSGKK